jgi:hypothetical protein
MKGTGFRVQEKGRQKSTTLQLPAFFDQTPGAAGSFY